ncbi:hypothetical protein [Persicitalea jodogahamensis]|uniref:Uncharacterized protein n=1 Tax=Persicitalea jodogahamensis TaxID=402147 RepID=A0A8J3D512_9BACT|nr:hypothetical protein [Persicitalea jodogahamensis]GHB74954.1 hypothetical protein GCM10007390_30810 [Persicitalea jodogahamensis]
MYIRKNEQITEDRLSDKQVARTAKAYPRRPVTPAMNMNALINRCLGCGTNRKIR